jgi:peptidoglycan/LPS O-acetylase OafA/YrhL
MRKVIVTVVGTLTVIAGVIVWLSMPSVEINRNEILMLVSLILVVGFALFLAYGRYRNARQNLPVEDEMSRNILRRGAATSYYLSLYLWLAIMMFEPSLKLDRSSLIGAGILGMAVLYALSWIYHRFLRKSHD